MSRGKDNTKHVPSQPRRKSQEPATQETAGPQPHRIPTSITDISSRQPIARAPGSAEPPTQRIGRLLGSLVDFVAEFDRRGVLLDVWAQNESLLVRPLTEMLGKPLNEIIGGDEYRPFDGLFERIHSSGVAEDIEYSLTLAGGLRRLKARAIPVEAPERSEPTICVLVQDVTKLRNTEEHSRKMESLLAHTQELANVGSWEYDAERRTFLWSEQMYRMLGLEPAEGEVELKAACQMFHPEDRARVWQDVMKLIETGEALENELRFVSARGEARTFFSRAIPIKDANGTVRLIRGFSQDVTDRREAETKLRRSQDLLTQAEEIAHLGSWELGVGGETRMLSDNLFRIIGENPKRPLITVEEALGRMEPDDAAIVKKDLELAMKRGTPFDHEVHYQVPDGRVRILHVRCVPAQDEAERVTRLIGIAQDVTEQREMQRARRHSEKHYEILLNSLKDYAVLSVNRSGHVASWHGGAERLLGYRAAEILGMHLSHFYIPEDIASEKPIREFDQAVREGRFEGQGWRVRKDGSRFWAEVVIAQLRDDQGRLLGLANIIRDITERKSAEEELAKSEALLAEAESLANIGSWELDLNTGEMNWSLQLYRILGYDPARTPSSFADFSRLIHIDRSDELGRASRSAAARRYPLESVVRWELPDKTIRALHTRAWPAHGVAGEPRRMIGTTEDVTERSEREDELRHLSRQLLHARDTERRRVARDLHDTVVQGLASIKMQLGGFGEVVPVRVRRVIHSLTQFTDETIRQARTICHLMHPPLLDESGLYPALRWYVRGFAERSGIATQLAIDENFGRLEPDSEIAIFRVVQEALTNVHKHSGSPDAIVRVAREQESVVVEVEDHGRGMPPACEPRRANEVQLGVGTAGMRERVAQLNGTFEIQSSAAHGTIVRAMLPAPERGGGNNDVHRNEKV